MTGGRQQDGWRRDGRRSERGGGRGADKARIARQFIEAIPFSKALGMRLDEIGDGVAVISMPYNPALVGDPQTGVIHGGAVSALMDTCGGAAVMSHPEALAATATIDLRIDYMRPANAGRQDHGAGPLLSSDTVGRLRPGGSLGQRRGAARRLGDRGLHRAAGGSGMSARRPPEPVQVIRQRRDRALSALVEGRALSRLHGDRFDRRGDELTAVMTYDDKLIGNPMLPALHGGAIASFLEVAAIMELSFQMLWDDIESGVLDVEA
jgi:uncharacterized protein (TIGR00369 family)